MFSRKTLIAAATATAALASAPALAAPPQATANLVNGNAAILVEAFGDGSAQVTQVILVTPEGDEIYAQGVNRATETETVSSTTSGSGYNPQPTGTLSFGTGYTSYGGRHGHSGSYNSVGLGVGVPLTFGGNSGGRTTTSQTVTRTSAEALIQLPQPMRYLQLWQDYRVEVVYRENGVEKVLTVPSPRPRGASS
jgi:hypothetical protein